MKNKPWSDRDNVLRVQSLLETIRSRWRDLITIVVSMMNAGMQRLRWCKRLWEGTQPSCMCSVVCDMWSFGVILYEMYAGKRFFNKALLGEDVVALLCSVSAPHLKCTVPMFLYYQVILMCTYAWLFRFIEKLQPLARLVPWNLSVCLGVYRYLHTNCAWTLCFGECIIIIIKESIV